jgi:hypothetical protein
MIRDRDEDARVDESSEESFPASDAPAWTIGGRSAEEPPPPPGTAMRPAPVALTSASFAMETAPPVSPAVGRARPWAEPGLLLAGAGGMLATAAVFLTLVGRDRLGRGLGHAGTALLLAGIYRRLGALSIAGSSTR